MAGDNFSMREAARVLGVSQIRVRELIRKGTLRAEKVSEAGQERWTILATSVNEYLERRPPRTDGQAPTGALAQLVSSLDVHLRRVRKLADELGEAQALVDRLKAELTRPRDGAGPAVPDDPAQAAEFARKAVEAAKRAVEQARKDKPPEAAEPAAKAPPAKPEAPKAETPKAETPKAASPKPAAKAPAPKPAAKKAPKPAKAKAPPATAKKDGKSETTMGAALRTAGVRSRKPAAKSKGKKK